MDDLIQEAKGRWSKAAEFDGGGKQIRVTNFEVLTTEEVTKRDGHPPMYPPFDGYVRRLTFEEDGYLGERRLDMNSRKFQNDLSRYGIKKGDVGILKRVPAANKKHEWTWLKI